MTTHVRGSCRRAWRQLAVIGVLLALPGCDRSPTAPEPARVAIEGTWAGTLTDNSGTSAQITMSVSGLDTLGHGTFALAFPDPAANASGLVQGRTNNAPTIDLALFFQTGGRDCATPGISYTARLALTGNRMTGTYAPAVGCALLTRGSMELTRR